MQNKSHNDEFEDIYSNYPSKPKFKVEINDDYYEDVTSFSEDYGNAPQVRYNSSADNRRRQEYSFNDPEQVYGNMIPEEPKSPKKRHPFLKAVAVFLSIVLILTGCVGYFAYSKVTSLIDKITVDEPLGENIYISDSELYKDDRQINILLVGTDAREKDINSRSDTMMLLTVDYKNGQIKLTSFLRDCYVQIARDGLHKEKLNAAFFRGGIQMLIDTLELNFKVKIPYYAIVDFEIFEKIIDSVGGITVEVSEKEARYINNTCESSSDMREDFPNGIEAGTVELDGPQALWYSRIRKFDSDFMRTRRQRKVISAIAEKAKGCSPFELYDLAEEILPMVRTNIPTKEITKMGLDAILKSAYKFPIVQFSIPADGTWQNKTISGVGDCLVLDFDKNNDLLYDFLKDRQLTDEEKK